MTPAERQQRILDHEAERRFLNREAQRIIRRDDELKAILSEIYGVSQGRKGA